MPHRPAGCRATCRHRWRQGHRQPAVLPGRFPTAALVEGWVGAHWLSKSNETASSVVTHQQAVVACCLHKAVQHTCVLAAAVACSAALHAHAQQRLEGLLYPTATYPAPPPPPRLTGSLWIWNSHEVHVVVPAAALMQEGGRGSASGQQAPRKLEQQDRC